MNKIVFSGLLMTDLSKDSRCTDHKPLTAKMHAYGFDKKSLKLIDSYHDAKKQRVKINSFFSELSEVNCQIPQGSLLSPLPLNIYMYSICCLMKLK